jgi:hypothetical protein
MRFMICGWLHKLEHLELRCAEKKWHLSFLLDTRQSHLEHRDSIDGISAVSDEARTKPVTLKKSGGGKKGRGGGGEGDVR